MATRMSDPGTPAKQAPPASIGLTLRVLGFIERTGNRLPHPFWLFVILSGVLVLGSWLLHQLNVTAVSPVDGSDIGVKSLLSHEGVTMMVDGLITNYATFPPLGVVVVVMLGVSVADKTGMLTAMLRAALSRVPVKAVTFMIAFTGMIAHIAADAAFVVMIPLGAIAYRSIGRSPMMGAVVAFVSVSSGHAASPLVTAGDALLASLTTAAAHTIDPTYTVTPVANYYFSLVSSVVLALVVTVVAETVLARRVAQMEAEDPQDATAQAEELPDLTLSAAERRGLRGAAFTALGLLLAVAAATVPAGSPLRGEGGALIDSTLVHNVAVLLALLFFSTGVVHGRATGVIRASKDIPDLMAKGLRDLAPVLVLFFAIAQFLAYFKWTGVGEIIAIKGSGLLDASGMPVLVIFVLVIIGLTVMNTMLTSSSAMWALVGPVFVPMLMLLNIAPETTWALYRIADSCTNSITPMSPYFVLCLGFVRRYRPQAGIGTLMSMTLPVAMSMLLVWTLLFIGWYQLGLPFGPGAPVHP
ncbi:AbgT family transporter [Streptomyces xiamenensis]